MTRAIVTGVCLSVVLFSSLAIAAQKKNGEERREADRIQQARKALSQAEERLKPAADAIEAASKRLVQLEQKLEAAITNVREVRLAAEQRLEKRFELAKAIEAHHAAQQRYEQACAPVLAAVRQSRAHELASAEAEEARIQLKQSTSTKLAETERVDLLKLIQRPAEIEKRALDADPHVVDRRAEMLEAQAKASGIRAQIQSALDEDPPLRDAIRAVSEAKDAVALAKTQLAQKRQALVDAREKVLRARQSLEAAQRADRKDDQQDRNRKRDGKGEGGKK
jgi:chromosome segregation ATPase